MAEKICVVGESGSGKSTGIHENKDLGIKGLNPKETIIINVAGKGLPFKNWKKFYTPFQGKTGNYLISSNSVTICKALKLINEQRKEIRNIVLDDMQYLLSFEFIDKALRKDWDKWSEMAKHIMDVIFAADNLRENIDIFFLTHSEDIQLGFETVKRIKTVGKLLSEKITLEGLFTVVLYSGTRWDNKEKSTDYFFVTNRSEEYPGKSPYGMFKALEIKNDLGFVKEAINKFYSE